jgi:hypothetical protein
MGKVFKRTTATEKFKFEWSHCDRTKCATLSKSNCE